MSREGKSETSTPESCRPLTAEGDLEHYKEAAIALVQRCVRNTQLEDLHAGIFPASQSGDYDDVKVISPYGEIPWNGLSRIAALGAKQLKVTPELRWVLARSRIMPMPPLSTVAPRGLF